VNPGAPPLPREDGVVQPRVNGLVAR